MPKTLPENIKEDFPALFTRGENFTYLDSAATTQKPQSVIEAVADHYRRGTANVQRGIYRLAAEATRAFEEVRARIARFIGAASAHEIVFTRNATESINLVAQAWGRTHLQRGDEVLLTVMEHHANIVPWQLVARERGATLRFVGLTPDGQLDARDLERAVNARTKLAAFAHVSNVLGTVSDARLLTSFFHERGIPVLIDGAQAVPHLGVSVAEIGCDTYVFSGHKMFGPTGVGILYAKREFLEKLPPFLGGGEMIRQVEFQSSSYREPPWRFEAGTPPIEAVIGLGAAVTYLERLGMDRVREHDVALLGQALAALRTIPGVQIYGPGDPRERAGVIAFTLQGVHPHDIASLLDEENICIRAGHHCAMPLHARLGVAATARLSFQVYNTSADIERIADALRRIAGVTQKSS